MHAKSTAHPSTRPSRILPVALWILQALLAFMFLFAGGFKLVLPVEMLAEQVPLPGLLVRCIGVIEVLGALGLVLPGLLRIRPRLTALAAAGLAIEMVVATLFSLANFGVAAAVLPLVLIFLTAFVAYGRQRLAPHPERSRASLLQPAS